MDASTVQIILAVLGSNALFAFLQFLITRKDSKDDKLKILEREVQEGLDAREAKGRERYEEHRAAIEELRGMMMQIASSTLEQQKYSESIGSVLMGLAQDKIVH